MVATAAEAEAVKKLLATGASFEALAMERSTDAATRFNGGDLGYFTTDVMPEAYDVGAEGRQGRPDGRARSRSRAASPW